MPTLNSLRPLSKPLASPPNELSINPHRSVPYGLAIATSILGLWVISLMGLMSIPLHQYPLWLIPVAVLWQMFLYTGLFITAHDAMHGSVCPPCPATNAWIGRLSVFAYGLFSYQALRRKHGLHHHQPASDQDPDFHDGVHSHPIAWYWHFMQGYWGWRQLIGFPLVFCMATWFLQVDLGNLLAFWVLPSLLSSMQLFYFGTFLTHRQPRGGYTNPHRTQTTDLPVLWSLITCYHFGYHEEHHTYPQIPWWQLPTIHQLYRCTQSFHLSESASFRSTKQR